GDPRGEYSEGHDDDAFKKNGRDTLSPTTEPNSGSMWDASSGVTVKVNSASGDVMNVTITFEGRIARYSTPINLRGMTAADLDGDAANEFILSGPDSVSIISGTNHKRFTIPGKTHPAVISLGGKNLLALPEGETLRLHGFIQSGPVLSAQIPIADAGGGRLIPGKSILRLSSNSGDRILFPVRIENSGNIVKSRILDISPGNTSNPSVSIIPLPDTSRVAYIAATGDFFAAAAENGMFCLGSLSLKTVTSVPLPSGPVYGLAIADFDRDEQYEAVATAGRNLIFAHSSGDAPANSKVSSGVLLPELVTQVTLSDDPVGEPIIADIDLDGFPEIVQCTATLIYAFRVKGVPVSGFPRALPPGDPAERIVSPPIVADLDADGQPDIAYATSNQRLIAHSITGKATAGYPLTLMGPISGSPLLIQSPGKTSLAWADSSGDIFTRDIPVSPDKRFSFWPMWRGGAGLASSLSNSSLPSEVRKAAEFKAFCYPNPITDGSGTFRIVPESATDCRITVFSADGKRVFEHYLTESQVIPGVPNEVRMDASTLASGLYIAKIQTRTGTEIYKLGVLK
ncbi:MAG: T9SS type A sorting domain-containing protein, partial [Candidatus Latescibacterota bacterium]